MIPQDPIKILSVESINLHEVLREVRQRLLVKHHTHIPVIARVRHNRKWVLVFQMVRNVNADYSLVLRFNHDMGKFDVFSAREY